MKTYKVIFANNEVVNCQVFNQRFDHDSEYIYEYMGKPMYAIVNASNEDGAKNAAKKLVNNVNRTDNLINPLFSAAA